MAASGDETAKRTGEFEKQTCILQNDL